MYHEARPSNIAGEMTGPSAGENWFADDVVVDFPALQPMVERMRLSFFGGVEPDEEPPQAEVCLTPAQARLGSRVPVEVPVRRVCLACGGRGEIWNEPCVKCAGRGTGVARHRVEVELPSGVHDGARLAFSLVAPHVPATRVHLRVLVS